MRKKLLITALVLLVVIGAAGIWAYNYYLVPDPEIEKELDEELGVGFFDPQSMKEELENYKKEGPLEETKVEGSIAASIIEKLKGSQTESREGASSTWEEPVEQESQTKGEESKDADVDPEEDSQKPSSGNNRQEPPKDKDQATSTKPAKNDQKKEPTSGKDPKAPGNQPKPPAVSEMDIVMEYLPQFEALEKLALSKLDTLIQTAYNEYTKKKKEGVLNIAELGRKYMQAANKLESNMDLIFNDLIQDLKQELEEHKLPTKVLDELKKEYKNSKSKKRTEVLSSLRSKVNVF